jgi:transcriptional regulator with XRE-family HTH domain
MVGMTREELATAAQVSHSALFDFESGRRRPHPSTVAAIRAALEGAGVVFVDENGDGPGVRLRREKRG